MCFSGTEFRATFLNNREGKFVFLEDISDNKISGGSMLIKRSDFQEFIKFITDTNDKLKEIKEDANDV
jgi:hypothetical protein